MGSEKYPDENEYDAFLAKHGGSSNAFTELVNLFPYHTSPGCKAVPHISRKGSKPDADLSADAHMQEYTNYHFDVKPNALYGALDRFAQFFIQPLCKADALEREVMAVDNEFTGETSTSLHPAYSSLLCRGTAAMS